MNKLFNFYMKYFMYLTTGTVFLVSMVLWTLTFHSLMTPPEVWLAAGMALVVSSITTIQVIKFLEYRNEWVSKNLQGLITNPDFDVYRLDIPHQYRVILATWWIWNINYFYPSKPQHKIQTSSE